jgi:hypothetical protein
MSQRNEICNCQLYVLRSLSHLTATAHSGISILNKLNNWGQLIREKIFCVTFRCDWISLQIIVSKHFARSYQNFFLGRKITVLVIQYTYPSLPRRLDGECTNLKTRRITERGLTCCPDNTKLRFRARISRSYRVARLPVLSSFLRREGLQLGM